MTLYATLGTDALRHGIIETESHFIIASIDQMSKIEVNTVGFLKVSF